MNKILIALVALTLMVSSCGKEVIQQPHKLLSRDRMISILVDIHLADAAYQTRRFNSQEIKNYKESDFYYSVLKKYHVPDSVFEKSLIYYSGKPKEFEKIYTRVINKLNELEQFEEKKKHQSVNIKNP